MSLITLTLTQVGGKYTSKDRSVHGAKGWKETISDMVIFDLSPQGRTYCLVQNGLSLAEKVTHFDLVLELELGQGGEPRNLFSP